jgi:hypothetical protein
VRIGGARRRAPAVTAPASARACAVALARRLGVLDAAQAAALRGCVVRRRPADSTATRRYG